MTSLKTSYIFFLTVLVFQLSACRNTENKTRAITMGQGSDSFQSMPESVSELNLEEPSKNDSITRNLNIMGEQIMQSGFKLENALPANYVTDATVDYTSYIQNVLDNYCEVIFPPFPILINENGLSIPSGSKIVFSNGSILKLKPNKKGNYKILEMRDVSKVFLNNPVIEGDRYNHLGTDGEWGMGIAIYSSNNIIINQPNVQYCWGDGIYISRQKGSQPPEDIIINGGITNQNRRNNITITSGVRITIQNHTATRADGTKPMAGLDIEPNSSEDKVNDIQILNLKTEKNLGKGIQIGLGRLMKNGFKMTNICIENHIDINSNIAVLIGCPLFLNEKNSLSSTKSSITFLNPQWSDNDIVLKANGFRTNTILLNFIAPRIFKQNKELNRKETKVELEKTLHSLENVLIELN